MSAFYSNPEDMTPVRFVCKDGDVYATLLYVKTKLGAFMEAMRFDDEYAIYLPDHLKHIVMKTVGGNHPALTSDHLNVADFLMMVPDGHFYDYQFNSAGDADVFARVFGKKRLFSELMSRCFIHSSFVPAGAKKLLGIAPYLTIDDIPYHCDRTECVITLAVVTNDWEFIRNIASREWTADRLVEIFPKLSGRIRVI